MTPIIKDTDLTRVPGSVKPDSKKRVILPTALVREGIIYHIWYNSIGQIILDPQVTIPASEAWLFNNRDALALVQQGLSDAAQGRVSKVDLDTL
jgi:hypothetical protein